MGREGIEPLVVHLTCFVTTALQAAARNTTQRIARVGVEPTDDHQALDLAALPICVTCRFVHFVSAPDGI